MLQCTIAGGQTKGANEKSFVFVHQHGAYNVMWKPPIRDSNQIPKLAENLRNICEGKLGYGECYNVLKTFQKNKSPGNDGLTVEFYTAFWPLIGTLLVDSLNYAFE